MIICPDKWFQFMKDQRGDSGNPYVNQVLSIDLIIYFILIWTTVSQKFIDALKFNLKESVEPLFLTSTDIKGKITNMGVFKTYSSILSAWRLLYLEFFLLLHWYVGRAKHGTWHSINRSSITCSYFSPMTFSYILHHFFLSYCQICSLCILTLFRSQNII